MTMTRVCADAELAPGAMTACFIDGWEIVVLRDREGRLHAVDGTCPHEDTPLVHGDFDGTVLTCMMHMWSFDVTTGRGVNPPTCKLAKYRVEVQGGDIFVDGDSEIS
jgi:toluene monooxygenase system ferredoxin subunit